MSLVTGGALRGAGRQETSTVLVDRRLYLDRAGRVVAAGDPARVRLLATPGRRLPLALAQQLGLVPVADQAPDQAPAAHPEEMDVDGKQIPAPPNDKARRAPGGTKAVKPAKPAKSE